MASWNRAHVLKAAFLLCILLLLLVNFSNFRSKFDANHVLSRFSARSSSTETLAMFSPLRLHSERIATNNNNNNNNLMSSKHSTNNNRNQVTNGTITALKANDNNDSNRSATNLNLTHPFLIIKHMTNSTTTTTSSTTSSINQTSAFSNKFSKKIVIKSNARDAINQNTLRPISVNVKSDKAAAVATRESNDGASIEKITTNFVFSNESRSGIAATILTIPNNENESDTANPTAEGDQNDAANKTKSTDDIITNTFLTKLMTKFGLNACPLIPPNLNGPIDIDIEYESLDAVEAKFRDRLLPGGWYKPTECNAKDRVAIVIPYRDRADHLPIFLKNIHPLLMKQQIEYGIFVIEQIADGLFNRAALMNVGFLEALKLHQWDCFIFHDIDLIPMDDRNLYTCPDQPRHMSVAVDTMGFKLPYSAIFGGVSAMTVKQFRTVNGFSNAFWGWGAEDDDMSNRLKHMGYHIARYPVNIARYTMLSHRKEKANPKRYEKLVNGVKKFDTEGLNSLKYKIHYFERKILYTWILAEIKQDSLMNVLASFFTKLK